MNKAPVWIALYFALIAVAAGTARAQYCANGGGFNNLGSFQYGFCSIGAVNCGSDLCETDYCYDYCFGYGYQSYCVGADYCQVYPGCFYFTCA
ncbi:hypothetical protein F183_A49860 [Bryobacterales bacterium F-183]|nr:hypothetical protein F183_A49860 [Bryobacterales bacterium F-183]